MLRWLDSSAIQTVDKPYAHQVRCARQYPNQIREGAGSPTHGPLPGWIPFIAIVFKAELKNDAEQDHRERDH